VYCPRCGTPNEPGDRFCSSCGAGLGHAAGQPREQRPARERLASLLGTTRRARLLTAGTLATLVVALVAFIALPADESIPRDRYTIAADRLCLDAKREIVAAERRALRSGGESGPAAFAQDLVPIISAWRSEFQVMRLPSDRIDEAVALTAALRKVEIELSALSLTAERSDRGAIERQAKRVDAATGGVEEAISALNLEHCEAATIGFARPAS
jgi:hypothetical protein